MNAQKTAFLLLEMGAGIILGFVAWSYIAPALGGQTTG